MSVGKPEYLFTNSKPPERKISQTFSAPFDVRLPEQNKRKDNEVTTVVKVDLCAIGDTNKLDERGGCGLLDLVVEILSFGNLQRESKLQFEVNG